MVSIIQPIKKIKVSEQVFLPMKKMIIENEWVSGTKLPSEHELCGMFGVSRVTIRNSLQKLSALGLIRTRLGDGSYVQVLDGGVSLNNLIPVAYLEEDFASILEFRREVESGTCAIAAQNATDEDVKKLRNMLEKMLSAQNDLDKLHLLDLEFHYMIAHISRNSLLIKTYEIVSDIYSDHMKRMVKSMGGKMGAYWHKKIVDAIEAHDAPKAREYMLEHINRNKEFVETSKTNIV